MDKAAEYKQLFLYDESSHTCIRTKVDKWGGEHRTIKKKCAGEAIGWLSKDGYGYARFKGRAVKIHHIVLTLHDVFIPDGCVVDHIDGNGFNNTISNLRVVERTVNLRNQKQYRNNSTGTTGVYWQSNVYGGAWAVAQWYSLDGKRATKSFSVQKLGVMVAFRDAVIHRQKMIEELNSQGAGYTERHGN